MLYTFLQSINSFVFVTLTNLDVSFYKLPGLPAKVFLSTVDGVCIMSRAPECVAAQITR